MWRNVLLNRKVMLWGGALLLVGGLVLAAWLMAAPKARPAADAETFARANQLAAKGQYEPAASLYQQLLDGGVRNADVYFNYGQTETAMGNAAQASEYFAEAQALAPRDAQITQANGANGFVIPLTQNEIAILLVGVVSVLAILLVRARRRLLFMTEDVGMVASR